MLSLPRPVFGGAPTSPAWDPWLRPTPAPDPTNVYREPPAHPHNLPHPLPPQATWRPQRKKHKKRETPPFLKTTVHLLILVAFFFIKKKKKVKGGKKKRENCKPRKLFRKNYLKLSDPDQHPPNPFPVIPCLECVYVFTPIPLLVAPCAGGSLTLPSTELGSKGCSRQLPTSLRAPPQWPWALAPLT